MINENERAKQSADMVAKRERARLDEFRRARGDDAWASEVGTTLIVNLQLMADVALRPSGELIISTIGADLKEISGNPRFYQAIVQGIVAELKELNYFD